MRKGRQISEADGASDVRCQIESLTPLLDNEPLLLLDLSPVPESIDLVDTTRTN